MPDVGRLTLRLGDRTHAEARKEAKAEGLSLTAWIIAAIHKELGRAQLADEVDELRERVERLERERRS